MTKHDHNSEWPENPEGRFDGHVDEADLILYLDHELCSEDSARVRSHLECCAQCRQLESELEEASATFSSLQRDFDAALPAPPQNWAGFEQRLAGVLSEQSVVRISRWNTLRDAWHTWWSGATILPWGFAATAIAFLVSYLWLHSTTQPTLSFADILNRVDHQVAASTSTVQPVIYRKLRIQVSDAPTASLTVELWKRRSDGRVKELEESSSAPDSRKRMRKAALDSNSGLLAQVNEVYGANHLDWSEPISAAGLEQWIGSDGPKDERIDHERLPDGSTAYRLIARAKNPITSPSHDVLGEMQLLIRASDWHALEERLTVQAPSGVRTYEVAELEYRELQLSEVPNHVFEGAAGRAAFPLNVPEVTLGVQPLSGAALTLDVLQRLDALDALTKDQIEITPAGTEGLRIEGTVASDRRKAEILAALRPLSSNPALVIDVVSPVDAANLSTGSKSSPPQVQSIQVPIEARVSNAYLNNWLAQHRGLSGSKLDTESQRFQIEAVVLSSDAQLQAQALKHILALLPTAPRDGEAAEKWRSLVHRHVVLFSEKVQSLEQQLAPVFRRAAGSPAADNSGPYNHIPNGLKEEADRLLDLATASDDALWQAFSSNSTDINQCRLTEPQFWLMIKEEHSLATHLMQQVSP